MAGTTRALKAEIASQQRKIAKLQAANQAFGLVLDTGASSTPLFGGGSGGGGGFALPSGFMAPPVGVGRPFAGVPTRNIPSGSIGPGVPAPRFDPRAPLGPGNMPDFTGVACGSLSPGTIVRQLCEAAVGKGVDVIGGFLPGGDKSRPAGPTPCKTGQVRVGDTCVDITKALPGGDPLLSPAGGVAVQGSFGLPAIQPAMETRVRRSCPAGMVLGKDNLCYPRQILSRRSNFRKWKAPRRPPISVRDAQAIRRAERAKSRVKALAKNVGFSVKKR